MVMKVRALILISALLAASCGKTNTQGPAGGQAVTITAGFEQADFKADGTKVGVEDSGVLTWSAGDKVAVWTSNGSSGKFAEFTLSSGEGQTTASFTGVPDAGFVPGKVAVYPASAAVSFEAGSLTVNYPETYAYGEGEKNVRMAAWFEDASEGLSFKHVGGLLSFTMSDIPAGVNCFMVYSTQSLCGDFSISKGNAAAASAKESAVSVTFEAGSISEGCFVIPVPTAGSLGLTAGLYRKEGESFTVYHNSLKSTVKSIGRTDYVKMKPYAVPASFTDDFLTGVGSYFSSVSSTEETVIAPGLTRLDVSCDYIDAAVGETSALRRNIFIYKIDLDRMTLHTTVANNDPAALWTLQKPSEQFARFQSGSGTTVYGGVNGDYYMRDSDNRPYGVFWKEGQCLKSTFDEAENCRIFAILNDGTARIWHSRDDFAAFDQSMLREVVCGRLSILKDGKTQAQPDDKLEPRTAIGIDRTGHTAWLMVVDGRDSDYSTGSNGVSRPAQEVMFRALGAFNAFNLDGGGSSTFVARSGSSLKAVNKPAEKYNIERAVSTGLAICPKHKNAEGALSDMTVKTNEDW